MTIEKGTLAEFIAEQEKRTPLVVAFSLLKSTLTD